MFETPKKDMGRMKNAYNILLDKFGQKRPFWTLGVTYMGVGEGDSSTVKFSQEL
jgi:hypothetical protein